MIKYKSMENLLILGNGFDLNSGLESSYDNFVEWLKYNEYSSIIWNELLIKGHELNLGNWCNVEKLMQSFITTIFNEHIEGEYKFENKYYNHFGTDVDDEDYIKRLILFCFSTLVTKRIYIYNSNDKINRECYLLNDESIKETLLSNESKYNDIISDILSINLDEKILKSKNKYEIINENIDIINQKNHEMYTIDKNNNPFVGEKFILDDNFIDINEYVVNILEEDLKFLEDDFKKFLNDKVNNNNEYVYNANILFSNISNKCLMNGENIGAIFSFNYTNPFDEFNNGENLNVINVHGDLSENDSIIFGFNKLNFENCTKYELPFTKNYQNLCRNYDNIKLKQLDMSSGHGNKIIIYGHSLNEFDYEYFFNIFDRANLINNNSHVIIYFCYSEYDKKSSIEIKKDNISAINDLLNSYGEIADYPRLLNKLIVEGRIRFVKI